MPLNVHTMSSLHSLCNIEAALAYHVPLLRRCQLWRQGIKAYGEWPTFPQLWVRGDLLGGCDIVETLAAEGSLKMSIDDMLNA